MGSLARSGHGRCVAAPFMVSGPQRKSMLPRSSRGRLVDRIRSAGSPSAPEPSRAVRRHAFGLAVAATLALVLSALGPAVRIATVSADGVPGLPDLTFYGRGYGHGVGMSQYGARGRALA